MPMPLEEVQEARLHAPGVVVRLKPVITRALERVHHFAVDVPLLLRVSEIADAYRPAIGVPLEPGNFKLGDPSLPGDAIEALQRRGIARYGLEQPLAPGFRLLVETGDQQRVERERRITQPALAVIPIPLAAQSF